MKYDFLFTDKDRLGSVTLGGLRNPQITESVSVCHCAGHEPNTTQINSYYSNAAYTHTFSPNILNEFRLFLQRNKKTTFKINPE